jgi:hypothetical protein
MDRKFGRAIPAIAGVGLSLSATACVPGSDHNGQLAELAGDWNLETVIRINGQGKEIAYAYPSVRHYSDCTNTKSAVLHVSNTSNATMRIIDHYECMGQAKNDNVLRDQFEVETIESGRRWYLYYLWDHAPSAPVDQDDQDDQDDEDENGSGNMPIPERELWYTCTAEDFTLICDDMLVQAPAGTRLLFAHEDPT